MTLVSNRRNENSEAVTTSLATHLEPDKCGLEHKGRPLICADHLRHPRLCQTLQGHGQEAGISMATR